MHYVLHSLNERAYCNNEINSYINSVLKYNYIYQEWSNFSLLCLKKLITLPTVFLEFIIGVYFV